MSSTQPTTPAYAVAPTTAVTNNSPAAALGKDAFLQLLVTQMKDQDPTSPTDSSAFMSQLAQFSSLEQMTNMSGSLTNLAASTAVNQGVSLIGRNLTWTRADGSDSSGIAQSVSIGAGGTIVIKAGTETVDPSQITGVGEAPATGSETPATTP
jgi:flagellar basal-body rod modification protein FlgD